MKDIYQIVVLIWFWLLLYKKRAITQTEPKNLEKRSSADDFTVDRFFLILRSNLLDFNPLKSSFMVKYELYFTTARYLST